MTDVGPGETHFDIHTWRAVRHAALVGVLDGWGSLGGKDLSAFTGYVVTKITVDASSTRCVNSHHSTPSMS